MNHPIELPQVRWPRPPWARKPELPPLPLPESLVRFPPVINARYRLTENGETVGEALSIAGLHRVLQSRLNYFSGPASLTFTVHVEEGVPC